MAINMKRIAHVIIVALVFLLTQVSSSVHSASIKSGETIKDVQAEGACAIVGISAEQSQLTALQRARAAAIEQAAGVSVSSGTLVTNYVVAADFIKTYAKGFIVAEKVSWLPLGQYQKDVSTAPIPEYRVRIIADVYIPEKKAKPLGLRARLNNTVFRAGEKAVVTLKTAKESHIAIFNIMADDRVSLLFPNQHEQGNYLAAEKEFIFPARGAKVDLEMQTLPGHRKDAEAIFVIAWDSGQEIEIMKMFTPLEPVPFGDFFKRLAEIAEHCEDVILPYEVVAGQK